MPPLEQAKSPAPVMARLGLETDEDPYLGLVGVVNLRVLADALEEHHVDRARRAGWSWAEVGAVLEVTAQAAHKKHAGRTRPPPAAAADGTVEGRPNRR